MKNLFSPFRYPGGKQALTEYLKTFIKENLLIGSPFYETHAGGAAISLNLLMSGLVSHVTLIEKDPLIYSFWKSALNNTEQLCNKIQHVKVSLPTWYRMQKYLVSGAASRYSQLDLGMAGLFLNRTSFSGILHAGPIGGFSQKSAYKINCRFNKNRIIVLLRNIERYKSKISVINEDAVNYLRKNSKIIESQGGLVYIDPPYYVQGKRLYRYHYVEDQHAMLAKSLLEQRFPWIVSYDFHPNIIRMFKGHKIVPITLNYTVKKNRTADELLISNMKLLKPVYLQMPAAREERVA